MGSAPSRRYKDGLRVMIDTTLTGEFSGELKFGVIMGASAALEKNNFEYTVCIEDAVSECVDEQYITELALEELPWVSAASNEVAVTLETHGTMRFAAMLVARDDRNRFEVKFVSDGTVLESVEANHLSDPNDPELSTCSRDLSPETLEPDPLWLLDRKIQAYIDQNWRMDLRIRECLSRLQMPRKASMPPLCGPFVGKNMFDSESLPAHPAPLPELSVDAIFVDTWAKYAGKIKFAPHYKIGPSYPRFDAWVDSIDAGEPLYFHAAFPVYAGLICLGHFQGQAEWVRATDVALIGISLYVNGELAPGFVDPPLVNGGVEKYGHEACHFIPGCVSTYLGDVAWIGGVFCLAPAEQDMEVRDDIYSISAYHQCLRDWSRKLARERSLDREITVEVNLVLSTNYLANVRKVCAGAVRVTLSDQGMATALERLRDVHDNRLNSQAARYPKRPRKVLSEMTYQYRLEKHLDDKATHGSEITDDSASTKMTTPSTVVARSAQTLSRQGITPPHSQKALPDSSSPPRKASELGINPPSRKASEGTQQRPAPAPPPGPPPKNVLTLQPPALYKPPPGAGIGNLDDSIDASQ